MMVPGPNGRVLRARAPIMCVILYILHNVYIISKLFSIYFLIYLTPIRRYNKRYKKGTTDLSIKPYSVLRLRNIETLTAKPPLS